MRRNPIPVLVETQPGSVISASPQAVERVLANVLDNAVRYARSAVRVSVGPVGDGVLVVVSDDGPGIPADDRERVFERFTRLHDARDRDSGGTGLGLAIVSELIGAQGGRVRLLEAEGGGLRVELWFPAAEPRAGSNG